MILRFIGATLPVVNKRGVHLSGRLTVLVMKLHVLQAAHLSVLQAVLFLKVGLQEAKSSILKLDISALCGTFTYHGTMRNKLA